jgi:hypothetical protein|tara:strand:- start:2157 stop:2321 length:165 start_codon:yes stop_codon:yes gene_type:complete
MKLFKKLAKMMGIVISPKNTSMWIQVPMSAESTDDKINIIIATLNQLEQNIKIK